MMPKTTKKVLFEILDHVSDPVVRSCEADRPRLSFSHIRYVDVLLDFSDDWHVIRELRKHNLIWPLLGEGRWFVLSTVHCDDRGDNWPTRLADRVFKYTKWLREYKSDKRRWK